MVKLVALVVADDPNKNVKPGFRCRVSRQRRRHGTTPATFRALEQEIPHSQEEKPAETGMSHADAKMDEETPSGEDWGSFSCISASDFCVDPRLSTVTACFPQADIRRHMKDSRYAMYTARTPHFP
ncbi:hypothetical protein Bbelb_209230 [Branchiostoma belcheri]|nr:hypothetical protein Bbelb_209230 [Branchiostoma belcheri]